MAAHAAEHVLLKVFERGLELDAEDAQHPGGAGARITHPQPEKALQPLHAEPPASTRISSQSCRPISTYGFTSQTRPSHRMRVVSGVGRSSMSYIRRMPRAWLARRSSAK